MDSVLALAVAIILIFLPLTAFAQMEDYDPGPKGEMAEDELYGGGDYGPEDDPIDYCGLWPCPKTTCDHEQVGDVWKFVCRYESGEISTISSKSYPEDPDVVLERRREQRQQESDREWEERQRKQRRDETRTYIGIALVAALFGGLWLRNTLRGDKGKSDRYKYRRSGGPPTM